MLQGPALSGDFLRAGCREVREVPRPMAPDRTTPHPVASRSVRIIVAGECGPDPHFGWHATPSGPGRGGIINRSVTSCPGLSMPHCENRNAGYMPLKYQFFYGIPTNSAGQRKTRKKASRGCLFPDAAGFPALTDRTCGGSGRRDRRCRRSSACRYRRGARRWRLRP